jgi:hypothetical protein
VAAVAQVADHGPLECRSLREVVERRGLALNVEHEAEDLAVVLGSVRHDLEPALEPDDVRRCRQVVGEALVEQP